MTDSQQLGMNLPDTQPVERVDEFKFEPIKGYPMLNWRGKRPFTSTKYYPAQLKEVHGEEVDGWLNKIYWGDNLQVMSHLLKEYRGKIDLVYIDPPFDSKADYKKKIKLKGESISNDLNSFEEKQYTDIWLNDDYLQYIYERLIIINELMSSNASIYLHCDYTRMHHIRCLMDEVFGSNKIVNQIIWKRQTAHSDTSQGSKHLGRIHDVILYYSKSDSLTLNMQYQPYSKQYVRSFYKYTETESGRRYRLSDTTGPGGAAKGNPKYEFLGVTRYWRYSQDKMQKLYEQGRIVQTKPGTVPQQKRYLDEMPGVPLQDLWLDVNSVQPQSLERQGYPTQKPEELLKRIIKTSTNPGDIVFDCFMGSGTTQSVAAQLGRRFIGSDINLGAVNITTKRLLEVAQKEKKKFRQPELQENESKSFSENIGFEVYNVNYYDVFRNPVQAKDLLIEALEINPLSKGSLFDGEKDGRMWKIMTVNRIATKADLSPLINGFDYKAFEKRQQENPKSPVEKITLVCMGHDPDLKAALQSEVKPYEIDVAVVDILRDRQDLQFKRDSEAEVIIKKSELVIHQFYPMNLLSKLSLQQESIEDWREMVESVMIDWNYDGAVLEPKIVDIPGKNELVQGKYTVPEDAGTIRIKITDLLSESLEMEVQHG